MGALEVEVGDLLLKSCNMYLYLEILVLGLGPPPYPHWRSVVALVLVSRCINALGWLLVVYKVEWGGIGWMGDG